MKKLASATDPLWYKDAIIYELHVRAFADSNDDGIGDFPGLISKLDYLQELGVTCLWILPFFPSPLRDDGYDIADYVSVNPSYGTLDDFQRFLDEAHARNMQVMIELVINHTSDQHPWFQKARHAPKGSPERNMYVWSDTDKLFEGVRIIFTDTEKSNWTWDEVAQQYYWHRFFSHQPDLNFDNPAVMHEVLTAMRFWLDMGVDGLRLDAIPYLVERDGTSCENVPETHELIKKIRAVIDAEYDNRLVLAEANMWPADVRPYFGDGDECHMAFHFPLMPRIYMALRQEDRLPITDIMAQTPEIPANCQWGLFLRNHDELTLEMVTDDERDYMYMAYSADPRMRINVGIRRRLAPLLDNNRRRIELLNSLLFSFPGTPILYYGDEIGMGDNIYLGDRNGVRTPMQWNSDRNAGFSKAVPARLYFPVIMDPIWGYQAINVEAQESDPSSLLHWTRNMIALRKLFRVFGRGTLEFLHPENRKVLAYIRSWQAEDGHEETVLCVANLSRFAQPVQLDLARFAGRQPVEMLGYVPFPTIDQTPYALTLAPYSFFWLELQPGPQQSSEAAGEDALLAATPTASAPTNSIHTAGYVATHQRAIEEALVHYLPQQRWFGSKSRTIASVTLAETLPFESIAVLALVDVRYLDGATERYQLPLMAVSAQEAAGFRATSQSAVVLETAPPGGDAALIDATFSPAFQQALLAAIVQLDDNNAVNPTRSAALDPARYHDLPSRRGTAEQSNTSLLYDDLAILKLYRRLEPGENPDVEIARFLTEVAHFPHIPAYLGDLHTTIAQTTLAFLQSFAPNEGDGWSWMLNALGRVYDQAASGASTLEQINTIAAESLDAASLIGQRTAELHRALASSEAPDFAPERSTAATLASEGERVLQQSQAALDALRAAMPGLPEAAATLATQLFANSAQLHREITQFATMPSDTTGLGQRIRIHGDYHLGQLLRTRGHEPNFLIVDFEGEPARSLEERRSLYSPLRDVAGMLRSFSYVAHAARRMHTHAAALAPWAAAWEQAAVERMLTTYRATLADDTALLPSPSNFSRVLRLLIAEKALYELLYELNHRPDWLPIPLAGLLTLSTP